MLGQTVRLTSDHARKTAAELAFKAPHGSVANFRPPTRTVDQNSLLWSLLSEVSRAKPDGRTHTPDIWKCLFMQACGHAVQFEVGLDGAPFPLGFRSSRLTKEQFSELIEFIYEYGARHGIRFSDEQGAA
jgi:hypothetical protein